MKAARNAAERAAGGERPKLSLQQYNAAVWRSRATEYGADKYARGNYHGPPPASVKPVDQIVEYLDAAMRHLGKVAQAVNVAYGTGGDVGAALACPDDDASGDFPPSMLPHLAHTLAGLSIMVEIGVGAGILPADPGQPWKTHPLYAEVLRRRGESGSATPQKSDPDAERRRIEGLRGKASPTCARDGAVCVPDCPSLCNREHAAEHCSVAACAGKCGRPFKGAVALDPDDVLRSRSGIRVDSEPALVQGIKEGPR